MKESYPIRKRILLYSDCYVFSGSENVILNILGSDEIRQEYEIFFLYRHSDQYAAKMIRVFELNEIHAVIIPVKFKRFSDIFYNSTLPAVIRKICFHIDRIFDFFMLYHCVWVPLFVRKIKKIKPDVIHINNGGYPGASSCFSMVFAAGICDVSAVLMHVNNLAFPRKWYDIKYFVIDRYLQKAVHSFITGSKAASVALEQLREVESNKTISINNTVFRDQLPLVNAVSVDKKSNDIWVGYVGLLTKRKGVHVLVEAIELLKNRLGDNVKVIIVGDGEEHGFLKTMIAQKKIDRHFLFTGYTAEVSKYLQLFDIFVLPSLNNEDFPYVILEAMICRKPVISTRVAGIPEIVADGESGYIVSPGASAELSEKIALLLDDREKRNMMGENGFYRYQNFFSYNDTMRRLLEIYKRTVT